MVDDPDHEAAHGEQRENPVANEHNLSALADAVEIIGSHMKADGDAEQKRHEDNIGLGKKTFWAVLGYAALTAIIAIASIVSTIESRVANKRTREAVTQSARAAAAAEKQSQIMADTEQRQLRPYINVNLGSLYNSSPEGKPLFWHVPINIENNGSTQTSRATSEFWCTKENFQTDDPMKSASIAKLKRFFGPKQTAQIGTCDWTPEVLNAAAAGSYYLFLAVRIVYYDNIVSTVPHITEMCQRAGIVEGDFSKPTGFRLETFLCDIHNCADDECPKEDL